MILNFDVFMPAYNGKKDAKLFFRIYRMAEKKAKKLAL